MEETHSRRTDQFNLLEKQTSELLAEQKLWQDHLDDKAGVICGKAAKEQEEMWQQFAKYSVEAQNAALAAEEEMKKLSDKAEKVNKDFKTAATRRMNIEMRKWSPEEYSEFAEMYMDIQKQERERTLVDRSELPTVPTEEVAKMQMIANEPKENLVYLDIQNNHAPDKKTSQFALLFENVLCWGSNRETIPRVKNAGLMMTEPVLREMHHVYETRLDACRKHDDDEDKRLEAGGKPSGEPRRLFYKVTPEGDEILRGPLIHGRDKIGWWVPKEMPTHEPSKWTIENWTNIRSALQSSSDPRRPKMKACFHDSQVRRDHNGKPYPLELQPEIPVGFTASSGHSREHLLGEVTHRD